MFVYQRVPPSPPGHGPTTFAAPSTGCRIGRGPRVGRTGASGATLMRPGHFGERSLLRGGDCVVPEAGMRSFFPMINGASQIDQLGVHWFIMVCFIAFWYQDMPWVLGASIPRCMRIFPARSCSDAASGERLACMLALRVWFAREPRSVNTCAMVKLLGFLLPRGQYYGYGSIPINTILSGMNIHLPAILMFTRGTRFWHTAILLIGILIDLQDGGPYHIYCNLTMAHMAPRLAEGAL